ncbi:hypothetical protein crov287 [Cafeteria roenbergensis virus]|uniref:Uncharacterized protein n=1 Tax=Cafeteria roenbergensis virus (strain BV-PW1) TaxID=693272 RepID=E3T557_CROVB|nr:hypothetical protein crov287 [Cafeteria roenbergensis virus BV-PW1]ADO67320.1 hypothetical protein crov287 [Cafeteria roenbergensis virus BV-PW1]
MADVFSKKSISFDYNTINADKIQDNFYDWYVEMYGTSPICLYLNLLDHSNKNDFISFNFDDKTNKLVSNFDTYKEYMTSCEYCHAISVIEVYLKYLRNM